MWWSGVPHVAGWREVNSLTPLQQLAFRSRAEASRWLRAELEWLAIDLPSSDPRGDAALTAAKDVKDFEDSSSVRDKEYSIGEWVYYLKRNKTEISAEKNGER